MNSITLRERCWLCVGLCAALLFAARADAQIGEQARITTRSDVKMSIEGALGTGGPRLEALAKHLGGPLGEVKRCYSEIVKENPEVTGVIQVELSLPEGKKAADVSLIGADNLHKKMRACVQSAFKKVTGQDVPRPAKARVLLELSNSAAESAHDVREKEQEASRVVTQQDAQGKFVSEGKSTQGEISYRVSGASKEVVEKAHDAVRDALPSLFDCRRRAGKLGSPEGELTIQTTLHAKSNADVAVKNSTVKNERAIPCVERALKSGLARRANGRVELLVRFAP